MILVFGKTSVPLKLLDELVTAVGINSHPESKTVGKSCETRLFTSRMIPVKSVVAIQKSTGSDFSFASISCMPEQFEIRTLRFVASHS